MEIKNEQNLRNRRSVNLRQNKKNDRVCVISVFDECFAHSPMPRNADC